MRTRLRTASGGGGRSYLWVAFFTPPAVTTIHYPIFIHDLPKESSERKFQASRSVPDQAKDQNMD